MQNYLPKLLITGANGQLAQSLCQHKASQNYQVRACTHQEGDITDHIAMNTIISTFKPDIIVNTAAYTAVDQAEVEKEKALLVNFNGTKNLAKLCKKYCIPLIHLSTDYIFDGKKTTPYVEEDTAKPLNVYGKSKWLGENAVREYADNYLILRVSGVFSEYGSNFLKTILQRAREKKELRIVDEQKTCPTYAGDIADVLFRLLLKKAQGTYHFCTQEIVSWHAFAVAIMQEAKLPAHTIKAISASEFQSRAKRPLYSALDCSKLKRDFEILQPTLKEGIRRVIANLSEVKHKT